MFSALTATVFSVPGIEAQTTWPEIQHVRWPLMDIVMLSGSCGSRVLVAPTPGTTQWKSGSNVVTLCVEPVLLLQWATIARRLTAGEVPVTPKLRARKGTEFLILGRNPRKAAKGNQFALVANDSLSSTQWLTYASRAQVDTLLNAMERTAAAGSATFDPAAEPEPDTPVAVVSIPRPVYPGGLAAMGRVGRVWMEYVIGSDGRPREGSFRPLLADDPRFTSAAIHALRRGRFKPATHHGQAVSQRVFQIIEFRTRD